MPTYVYRREDGTTFEIRQRITEDALTECPETGQVVKRVISGNAGLIFKGSGFYVTDYVRNQGSESSGETPAKPASEPKATDQPTTSATTTP